MNYERTLFLYEYNLKVNNKGVIFLSGHIFHINLPFFEFVKLAITLLDIHYFYNVNKKELCHMCTGKKNAGFQSYAMCED